MAFKVKDVYRENPLSTEPGGYTVIVEQHSGRMLEYDKVKNPAAYIRTLLKDPLNKTAYVKE
jgi:hypothetical protein